MSEETYKFVENVVKKDKNAKEQLKNILKKKVSERVEEQLS